MKQLNTIINRLEITFFYLLNNWEYTIKITKLEIYVNLYFYIIESWQTAKESTLLFLMGNIHGIVGPRSIQVRGAFIATSSHTWERSCGSRVVRDLHLHICHVFYKISYLPGLTKALIFITHLCLVILAIELTLTWYPDN